MSPKEKAKELVYVMLDTPVRCALIAVDEIIKQLVPIERAPNNKSAFQYWQEVKQEIELL